MRVKLIKKLALVLNGFDLTPYRVGDVVACTDADGNMLIQEGWGQPVSENGRGLHSEPPTESVLAIIERLREGLKER